MLKTIPRSFLGMFSQSNTYHHLGEKEALLKEPLKPSLYSKSLSPEEKEQVETLEKVIKKLDARLYKYDFYVGAQNDAWRLKNCYYCVHCPLRYP